MPKISKLSLVISLLLLISAFNASAQTAKITAIRAQLFYDNTGKFSEDVLAAKGFALWNTIIGAGDAAAPSNSTFVTVEITGKNLPVGSTKIEITATGNKNKLLQKKLVDVEIYDEHTKFFAPLWLYNTGCEKIKISAHLLGKGIPATVFTKTIPFACGE